MKPPSSRAGPQPLTSRRAQPENARSYPVVRHPARRPIAHPDLFRPPPGIRAFPSPANDADVIVLAGDIANGAAGIEWAREAFKGPVIYLAGNHEYYEGEFEAVQAAMGAAARKRSVELLDCSEAVVDGVRFLGCTLWTDYSLAPQAERPPVIESARKLNPDYQLIRWSARAFEPEDAI